MAHVRDLMTRLTGGADKEVEERSFLDSYDSSVFEKVSVTTDILVFSISDITTTNYRKLPEKKMSVYLTQRTQFPFKDKWSLAGGFVNPKETLVETAMGVLKRKMGIDELYLEQLYTFDAPNRDPRMRILSVAYMALLNRKDLPENARQESLWFNIIRDGEKILLQNECRPEIILDLSDKQSLAFDHADIILTGLNRLQNKIEYTDLAFHLVSQEFTLTELQNVYEAILGKKLLAPAFRRVIKPMVEATGNFTAGSGHRPSALFRYKGATSALS